MSRHVPTEANFVERPELSLVAVEMTLRVIIEEVGVHVVEAEAVVAATLTVGKVMVEKNSIDRGVNEIVTEICFEISEIMRDFRRISSTT